MKLATELLTAALVIGATTLALPANAAPISAPAALQNASRPDVETVQWLGDWNGGTQYGPDYGYYGPRYGIAPGPYQPGPDYSVGDGQYGGTQLGPDYGNYGPRYGSGYSESPYESFAYSPDGATDQSYCQQRFRSFDPASGTYMGYDGRRHPCP
jgi:hypothetical protein